MNPLTVIELILVLIAGVLAVVGLAGVRPQVNWASLGVLLLSLAFALHLLLPTPGVG